MVIKVSYLITLQSSDTTLLYILNISSTEVVRVIRFANSFLKKSFDEYMFKRRLLISSGLLIISALIQSARTSARKLAVSPPSKVILSNLALQSFLNILKL